MELKIIKGIDPNTIGFCSPQFRPEYLKNCDRDSEFQPLGKEEVVWENQDRTIFVSHKWHKHTDPLTAPNFPYSEHFYVNFQIDTGSGKLSGKNWRKTKEEAIELARDINSKKTKIIIKREPIGSDWQISFEK